ncbi:MAG: hypothetical protein ACI3VB_04765 [Oscillospiraceae bacterium]
MNSLFILALVYILPRCCNHPVTGFVAADTKGIHYYAEPREAVVPYFLLKELTEGYLNGIAGVYHTPEGYFVDEQEVEMFDRGFPPKEKMKLPGQLV